MNVSLQTFAWLLAVITTIAIAALVARVPASDLTGMLFALTAVSWVSFAVLGRAAWVKPRIGALTERAFIAVIIAMLGTVSCLIVWNTDHGYLLFPREIASLLFRLSVLAVLTVPAIWLALWLAGRLGQGK
jgi:hypothetical protein